MSKEIERKFLVTSDSWRSGATPVPITQGYLCLDPERTIRVRLAGSKGFVTIKGRGQGIVRDEWEYEIPHADAKEMLALAVTRPVCKQRYHVHHGGSCWDIDVFENENDGLIVAEIELPSADATFDTPAWLGTEVSLDPKYLNVNLSLTPFSEWQK